MKLYNSSDAVATEPMQSRDSLREAIEAHQHVLAAESAAEQLRIDQAQAQILRRLLSERLGVRAEPAENQIEIEGWTFTVRRADNNAEFNLHATARCKACGCDVLTAPIHGPNDLSAVADAGFFRRFPHDCRPGSVVLLDKQSRDTQD